MKENNQTLITQKIQNIIDSIDIDSEKRAQMIYLVFLKLMYPEAFCKKCDAQMFFVDNTYRCFNCGAVSKPEIQTTTAPGADVNQGKMIGTNPGKMAAPDPFSVPSGVPSSVAAAINDAEIVRAPSPAKKSIASQILSLKNQIDGGGASPANEIDSAAVKADPNVGDVNWL